MLPAITFPEDTSTEVKMVESFIKKDEMEVRLGFGNSQQCKFCVHLIYWKTLWVLLKEALQQVLRSKLFIGIKSIYVDSSVCVRVKGMKVLHASYRHDDVICRR